MVEHIKHVFFCLLFLSGGIFPTKGEEPAVEVVNEFATHLKNWSGHSNNVKAGSSDYSPRIRLNGLLDESKFCLDTKQVTALAKKYRVPTSKLYDRKIFDDILVDAIGDGTDAYISDIKYVPFNERDPRYPEYPSVSCIFHISGIYPQVENCAFVLSPGDNKILKITPYTMQYNKKTGRRQMKVNLKGLVNNEHELVWGLGYNYSKCYPVGFGAQLIWDFLIAGVELGYAPRHPNISPYTTLRSDIKDLCNYEISSGTYFPKEYLTVSLGYVFKYVAVSYGFGSAILSGDFVTDYMSTRSYSDGSLQYVQYQTTQKDQKEKFLMRPNIRGIIPCGNGYEITLSLSYLWVPAYKQMNSFDFGIGFNFPYNN
ncbi:MAG: hypothetical protein HDR45_04385 [Bacteroides sp.]|nr:hypothetical protein [Bacteroides sp.]MBD5425422.1 hypothetical protein [Bacteroides sp.]